MFNYNWTLRKANFTKDKGKVFSCFAAGGGSTMGYKLAGFDVIGCNEIDPKMMAAYIVNHNPKYSYLEPIQKFKKRNDLPKELYNLDILDGSPPCSSFSIVGNRDKDWGKEKRFREGQAKQILDDLFFHFIDLAEELQPKMVIAENVKGLLQGKAMSYEKNYVNEIYKAFDKAGYVVNHYLLDSSKMGVPQRRERVFFIAIRKDLVKKEFLKPSFVRPIFNLDLTFNFPEIPFKEIKQEEQGHTELTDYVLNLLTLVKKTDTSLELAAKRFNGKLSFFSWMLQKDKNVTYTITANDANIYIKEKRCLSLTEIILASTFPLDYDFKEVNPVYICGMSVPPVAIANLVTKIYNQILSKL